MIENTGIKNKLNALHKKRYNRVLAKNNTYKYLVALIHKRFCLVFLTFLFFCFPVMVKMPSFVLQ